MRERRGRQDEDDDAATASAVPALVEAQLETARERVFRAYLRAREQARALANVERDERAEREGRHRRLS